MKNKKYIIIILIAIIFFAIAGFYIYRGFNFKTNSQNDLKIAGDKNIQNNKEENIAKIESDYEINFKNIFSNYLNLADSNKLSADDLKKAQAQTLDLKVPTKYKNLHIEFVFALIKMEKYLKTSEIQERDESQKILSKIKADHTWLN